ncbi:MAG: MAC/perforin domain-containing protein [Bacteroidia bacterium]
MAANTFVSIPNQSKGSHKKLKIMQNLTTLNVHHRSLLKHLMFLLLIASLGQVQAQSEIYPGSGMLGNGINLLEGQKEPNANMLLQTLTRNEIEHRTGGTTAALTEDYNSIVEASNAYSVSMGLEASYGAFSAKASMNISNSTQTRTQSKTILIKKDVSDAKLTVRTQVANLKLAPLFEKDLKDPRKSAIDLFNNWGTHITLGLKVGGRVSVVYTSVSNTKASQSTLEASAKASYGGVTGEAGYKTSRSTSSFSSDIKEKWIIQGGNSNARIAVETKRTPQNYINWARSVTNNPAFFAFVPGKLIPIWELLPANSSRRKQLKEAFEWEFTKKSLETKNLQIFTFESTPAKVINKAKLTVPYGYKILSGGAKSNFTGAGNMLTASYYDNNTWIASHKDHHVSSSSKIKIYVMAVYDPYDKIEVTSGWMQSPKGKWNSVATKYIPNGSSGWSLVGGGAYADYNCAGSILTGSYPIIDPKTGQSCWAARSMDFMVSCPATLYAFAIYARFKPGSPYKITTKTFGQGYGQGGVIKYNADVSELNWHLIGGGAVTSSTDGTGKQTFNFLTGTYPANSKKQWVGESKDHHKPAAARLNVIAIGLRVVKSK